MNLFCDLSGVVKLASNLSVNLRAKLRLVSVLVLVVFLNMTDARPVWASALAGNLLKQPASEITVSLSNAAGELKFEPNHLELVSGKRYKLHMVNPSNQKHYFTAKDFADGIWTQKVDAGRVEIKGAIHEMELRPGTQADWVFVALKPGTYSLRCPIPGHTEAGMTGDIVIGVGE